MSCAERGRRPRRFPLETRAARTPDAPALVFPADGGGLAALSFRDLERRTAVIASALIARGITPGTLVALRLQQDTSYPAMLLSLLRAGAVAVPLSTRLPEAAVPGLLQRVGCPMLIADKNWTWRGAGGIELIAASALLAAASERDPDRTPFIPLCETGRERTWPRFDRTADATIVFTSGSTGIPKAAVHSFQNHWASALGSNRNLRLRTGDRWLLSLPLWHVGGLSVIFRCLCGGAAVAVPGREQPLSEAIPALGVTHLSVVAAQLVRLLRDGPGRETLRSLKAVLLGGGPAPETLVEEAFRAGVPLITSYGSTETCSQATATAPGEPLESLRTAGRPLAFRRISIAADGEILAGGRTLFRGYLERGVVRPARDAAGWFHTGDLGRLDDAGRLVVVGRRDAMFVSGGENIHPEEIEREILGFPGVLEAVVVPAPDAEFGARPAAFLRTSDGTLPDPASIGAFLRGTLPGFKVPVRYLAWPDLAEGMKPDRRALAAVAAQAGVARAFPPHPCPLPHGGGEGKRS